MSSMEAKPSDAVTPSGVLVVIVNYRCADLTIACLESLKSEACSVPGMTVKVVDNASGDGSAERIADAIRESDWSDWASTMPLNENGGFARGNNAAIQPVLNSTAPPKYVLLLNPDTVVRPGAVSALVEFMDRRPDVGIAGSRLENPDGTPQRSAFRFPSVLGEVENGMRLGPVTRLLNRHIVAPPVPCATGPCDWVSGASMIVRREVFTAIGTLDDGFFLYYEEVDFCLRAHKAGWPCWYVPESQVVHYVAQSTGVSESSESRKRRPDYWFRARRHYFLKNHGIAKTIFADTAWAISFASFRLRRFLQNKPDRDPEKLLWDFVRHNFFRPMAGR